MGRHLAAMGRAGALIGRAARLGNCPEVGSQTQTRIELAERFLVDRRGWDVAVAVDVDTGTAQ